MYSEILVGLLPTSQVLAAASSALPMTSWTMETGLLPCLIVEKWLLLSSEASWHRTWPGYGNGEVWVLRGDHASSCPLSPNYISNREHRKRSLHSYTIRGGVWRFSQAGEAFGIYFGITQRLPSGSTSPRLGQLLSLAPWRGAPGRSNGGRYEASSCAFSRRAPPSYPEVIFQQSLSFNTSCVLMPECLPHLPSHLSFRFLLNWGIYSPWPNQMTNDLPISSLKKSGLLYYVVMIFTTYHALVQSPTSFTSSDIGDWGRGTQPYLLFSPPCKLSFQQS